MEEAHVNIIKSKFVGFRLAYSDWMRLMQLTSSMNLSITDFMHSILFPALNQYAICEAQSNTDVKQENKTIQTQETEQNSFETNNKTNNKIISSDKLFPKKYQNMLNSYLKS